MVANCTYAERRRAGNEGEHQRLVDANTQTARSGEILITYTTFFLGTREPFLLIPMNSVTEIPRSPGSNPGWPAGPLAPCTSHRKLPLACNNLYYLEFAEIEMQTSIS
jgi:hypothetical protein